MPTSALIRKDVCVVFSELFRASAVPPLRWSGDRQLRQAHGYEGFSRHSKVILPGIRRRLCGVLTFAIAKQIDSRQRTGARQASHRGVRQMRQTENAWPTAWVVSPIACIRRPVLRWQAAIRESALQRCSTDLRRAVQQNCGIDVMRISRRPPRENIACHARRACGRASANGDDSAVSCGVCQGYEAGRANDCGFRGAIQCGCSKQLENRVCI